MANIDPEQERQRLAARYAAMSDLELKEVGGDPVSLTERARTALQEEMRRRGLPWTPDLRIAKPIQEEEILNPLAVYPDRNAAGLARDFLAGKGIKVYLCEGEPPGAEKSPDMENANKTVLLARSKDLAAVHLLLAEKEKVDQVSDSGNPEASGSARPVVLRRYRDLPQAFVEKSVLEDAGIICYLQDDNVIRMDWLWSNAMGGIKLLVREGDAEEAERILREAQPEKQEGDGEAQS